MPKSMVCRACGKKVTVRSKNAGGDTRCPHCGAAMAAPPDAPATRNPPPRSWTSGNRLVLAGVAAAILIAATAAIVLMLNRPTPPAPRLSSLPKPNLTPPRPTPPPPEIPPNSPNAATQRTADPANRPPTPARQPPNKQTYENFVQQYGAARVARVRLTGIQGLALQDAIFNGIERAKGNETPEWRFSLRGDDGELLIAPIADLNALVEGLNLGTTTTLDLNQRIAVISVDRSRVPTLQPP